MSEPTKSNSARSGGELSGSTSKWLAESDRITRKQRGQYMTPGPVAGQLVDRITLEPGMRVLDPGVGTGELLRAALDRQPEIEAVGWDIDAGVIAAARELVPEAELEQRSALDAVDSGGFDLVIGNPPYFQTRLGREQRGRFAGVISGRANIFALFFQVGLEQLRAGGTLAYIVPPSMNSGAYFEGLREHLVGQAEVRDLTILEGTDIFEGANTAVQLLTLEKHEPPLPVGRKTGIPAENPTHPGFVFRRVVPEAGFERVLFSPEPARLEAEFAGRETLWEKGLEAVTGQVIWNENRERLADQPGPGRVPLIWSRDIGDGALRESAGARPGKPRFYDSSEGGRKPLTGPAIVVNRVVGAVGRGELRAALIPGGMEFLAENHVNVVRSREGGGEISWPAVLSSLRATGVAGRIRRLTGNTQISARELTHLLPLD